MTESKSGSYVFKISLVAACGGFLFGYDLGVIVGANAILKEQFNLNPAELGFATGSAVLGCIIGPFLGSFLADRIGRKKTMLIACVLLGISALFTAIPDTIFMYNIFRIVGGIGVGLCSMASPMYIAEIAPREKRGQLGIMYQLAIVIGHTISPLVGAVLAANLADDVSWRWMFASEGVAILAFAGLIFTIPNSPRWLASKGRKEEARAVLKRIGGEQHAEAELKEIESALRQDKGSLSEILAPGLRYALLIGLLLALFNNWTGWSVMGGYVAILLERAELGARWVSILQSGFVYFMMGLMALTSLLVVDRVGRRPLWIGASIAMAGITALAGAMFHFEWTGWIVLAIVGLCTIPHGLALGPLPWLMMSEIFPTHLRAKAVAITTTFLWIVIFLGAFLFPLLTGWSEQLIGSIGGAFWLFTVVCFASVAFGIFMLPETKGRTLEEIAESWKKK